jgi:hypothetical protein
MSMFGDERIVVYRYCLILPSASAYFVVEIGVCIFTNSSWICFRASGCNVLWNSYSISCGWPLWSYWVSTGRLASYGQQVITIINMVFHRRLVFVSYKAMKASTTVPHDVSVTGCGYVVYFALYGHWNRWRMCCRRSILFDCFFGFSLWLIYWRVCIVLWIATASVTHDVCGHVGCQLSFLRFIFSKYDRFEILNASFRCVVVIDIIFAVGRFTRSMLAILASRALRVPVADSLW